MNDALRPLKKGGYSNQPRIVRFRASTDLYEALQRLSKIEGLCVAAVVRRLVALGIGENQRLSDETASSRTTVNCHASECFSH